jgi:hypothetical protein
MLHFLSFLAPLVTFIIIVVLLRKLNAKIMAKYNFSLAFWAKAAVYSVAGVIVAIALVSVARRSGDLSTPLGKLVALHWRAGDSTVPDCRLCPDGLFIIICDADKESHISSLREMASLQADYVKNGQEWKDSNDDRHSCISNQSFRLKQHSGTYGFSYDPESAVPLRQEVSFQVIKENDIEQIVEVHYKDGMKDITDSLFRYEIRNDKINALESWVLLKVQVGLFLELAIVALVILLYGGIRASFRRYTSRRRKRMDERQIP